MRSVIPDANIFLRFILNDIPSQVKKTELLFNQAKKSEIEIIIPQIIIFEIQFALDKFYNFNKQNIIRNIKAILSADYFKINDKSIFLKALDLWFSKNISFPDAFLISYCDENNGELFTFDKKLNKLTSK